MPQFIIHALFSTTSLYPLSLVRLFAFSKSFHHLSSLSFTAKFSSRSPLFTYVVKRDRGSTPSLLPPLVPLVPVPHALPSSSQSSHLPPGETSTRRCVSPTTAPAVRVRSTSPPPLSRTPSGLVVDAGGGVPTGSTRSPSQAVLVRFRPRPPRVRP